MVAKGGLKLALSPPEWCAKPRVFTHPQWLVEAPLSTSNVVGLSSPVHMTSGGPKHANTNSEQWAKGKLYTHNIATQKRYDVEGVFCLDVYPILIPSMSEVVHKPLW